MGDGKWIIAVIAGMVLMIVVVLVSAAAIEGKERAEFMSYCQSKGFTDQDCKWEYERMRNGQKSNMIIIPMYMGK